MRYNLEIIVDHDSDELYDCLSSEPKIRNNRSSFKIQKHKNSIKIIIFAKDATALRASANTITSLLAVFEKTKKLENDKR